MKYVLKKLFKPKFRFFKTVMILLFVLQACNTNNNADKLQDVSNRKFHRIDLFSEKNVQHSNSSNRLTSGNAYDVSDYVLTTPHVVKTDSSDTRGVKAFYVYKVKSALVNKEQKGTKLKFPLYFISEENLFKEKINDSVSLYISLNTDFNILKLNSEIKYKWVTNAPFSAIPNN